MKGILYLTGRGEKEKQDNIMVHVYVCVQDIIRQRAKKIKRKLINNLLSFLLLFKINPPLIKCILIIFPLPLFLPVTSQVSSLPYPIPFSLSLSH